MPTLRKPLKTNTGDTSGSSGKKQKIRDCLLHSVPKEGDKTFQLFYKIWLDESENPGLLLVNIFHQFVVLFWNEVWRSLFFWAQVIIDILFSATIDFMISAQLSTERIKIFTHQKSVLKTGYKTFRATAEEFVPRSERYICSEEIVRVKNTFLEPLWKVIRN